MKDNIMEQLDQPKKSLNDRLINPEDSIPSMGSSDALTIGLLAAPFIGCALGHGITRVKIFSRFDMRHDSNLGGFIPCTHLESGDSELYNHMASMERYYAGGVIFTMLPALYAFAATSAYLIGRIYKIKAKFHRNKSEESADHTKINK